VVPKKLTIDQICAAAAFRSRGRLPVVTYLHAATKAVLTRSAQPLVGITQKNCPEDELLLNFYRLKGMPRDGG
jgi:myotubularin-related protein 1/2